METPCAVVALAAALFTHAVHVAAADAGEPTYRVTKSVPLGAPDRWDYLYFDASGQRVYVAHGDRVTVVDAHSGAVVGQVDGFAGGTHGIAIVPALGQGYTDDGRAGVAGAFDLKTLAVERRIAAAVDADAVAFDPLSGHIFTINGDGGTITVIDPKVQQAVATLDVGGKLEFAVAGESGVLYVNGAERREIVRIDTHSNQITARWPISNCESPHGLAIDPKAQRLFSSCVNNLLVIVDTTSGKLVASLPIGSGTDAVAFDPVRKLIFSSNGRDGTLSIIRELDPHTYVSVDSVKTAISARTMTIDPESGRLFLAAADVDVAASAGGGGPRRGPAIVPGSLKLLFLDPGP